MPLNGYSNVARILKDLKGSTLTCSALLKTKQREKDLLFSEPTLPIPSHSLQFLAARKLVLQAKTGNLLEGAVSLAQIATKKDVLFGIAPNRSHGPVADRVLAEHSKQIIYRSGGFDILGLIEMMRKERFDFTIEYPYVSYYELAKTGQQDTLYSLPIEEAQEDLFGYISCSNNVKGAVLIGEINKVLREVRHSDKLREMVVRWLPKSARSSYREQYRRYISRETLAVE